MTIKSVLPESRPYMMSLNFNKSCILQSTENCLPLYFAIDIIECKSPEIRLLHVFCLYNFMHHSYNKYHPIQHTTLTLESNYCLE